MFHFLLDKVYISQRQHAFEPVKSHEALIVKLTFDKFGRLVSNEMIYLLIHIRFIYLTSLFSHCFMYFLFCTIRVYIMF
jgi:hypothetical protein